MMISRSAPRIFARWLPFVVAGFGYLLLASIALHPLVANISSAIPGIAGEHADFAVFYWNIWWFQHAIFRLGQDPFFTNYILFPNTVNLAYHNTQDGWCLVEEEGPILAYSRAGAGKCLRVDRFAPPPGGTIDLGNDGDERYLGLGWYYGENIGGPQARWTGRESATALRVYLPRQNYRVTLRAASFSPDQTVTLSANETRIADLRIGEGWNDYVVDIPADAILPDGITTFTFVHARAESPADLTNDPNQDRRPLAVAYDSITFTPAGSP